MSQTLFIDSTALPRKSVPGAGEMTEFLNEALVGAKNVVGCLRWLKSGETYVAQPIDRHQLIYLMDGSGTITLQGQAHDVAKGMGVYLGPSEGATVTARDAMKLFCLVVPEIRR